MSSMLLFSGRDADIERKLEFVRRLKGILLPVAAAVLLAEIVCWVSAAPQSSWNDARLAIVAAWLRGYPLYTPENFGVLIGNFYPPLGALAFFPAALINLPVPAIIAGSILAFLMNISPAVGALMMWSRGMQNARELVLLGIVLYVGLLMINDASNMALFAIHVDAPAIALMLWGAIFYARWWTFRSSSSLAISAFLLSSVVWAKQLGIPLPFVFLAVTWVVGGLRPATMFFACSFAAVCFWISVLTPIVDWHAFIFDIWTVQARHPWVGQASGGALERLTLFVLATGTFLRKYWPLYVLLPVIVMGLDIYSNKSGEKSQRFLVTLTASALIVALTMMPFAVLGLVKVGGSENSAAHSVQPVLFGLLLGGMGLYEIARRSAMQWNVAAQLLICICLVGVIATVRPGVLSAPYRLSSAPVVTAYNESKNGNVWFPEFPLSTLLATGHLYHHAYSLYAIYLGGQTVPIQQLVDGIPKPPFVLKYRIGNPETSEASRMTSYLGLSSASLEQKSVGVWQEIWIPHIP